MNKTKFFIGCLISLICFSFSVQAQKQLSPLANDATLDQTRSWLKTALKDAGSTGDLNIIRGVTNAQFDGCRLSFNTFTEIKNVPHKDVPGASNRTDGNAFDHSSLLPSSPFPPSDFRADDFFFRRSTWAPLESSVVREVPKASSATAVSPALPPFRSYFSIDLAKISPDKIFSGNIVLVKDAEGNALQKGQTISVFGDTETVKALNGDPSGAMNRTVAHLIVKDGTAQILRNGILRAAELCRMEK
jgi:hypothetical protein